MKRLLSLIGMAHSRCPLAQAVAAGVRELIDDKDTRERVQHFQLSGRRLAPKRSARDADTSGRATQGERVHGHHG